MRVSTQLWCVVRVDNGLFDYCINQAEVGPSHNTLGQSYTHTETPLTALLPLTSIRTLGLVFASYTGEEDG